ncbi:RNAse P Rpr2/Rpp21/SNM1 subunit domain-containing protein [Phakopsora pachyrhizi]|uniref:RNAse P Rpr2/Rpp21/SNM1 subunit domain-domain-containing protein n=1 Tax=Phakopsora pachyrhizi TaxID=170000 RepID=A0AAV0BRT3_PHAPC|nr:RNAse P Rpr2/Rpp21/SNM1 subunit domain-containing protein [Phakopsora pachyrhizi]CAH7688775.1 RNAse P Rpr2/Rpp21/SNM1 subunit domain-domain-containing protein [Phakopsora pachyrhizi]
MKNKKNHSNQLQPNPNSVQNRDVFQRMNFMYQASHLLSSFKKGIEKDEGSVGNHRDSCGLKRREDCSQKTCLKGLKMVELSRSMSKSIRIVAKKSVLRLDPSIKRTICRSCDLILIPGRTSSTRLIRSGPDLFKLKVTCLGCGCRRSILNSANLEESFEKNQQKVDSIRQTRRSKRQKKLPFWNRPEHIIFVGQQKQQC